MVVGGGEWFETAGKKKSVDDYSHKDMCMLSLDYIISMNNIIEL